MLKLFGVGVLFLTIFLLIDSVNSVNCYQCRTDVHTGCDDPSGKNFSHPCDKKSPSYCRKITQRLKHHDEETIIRECAYEVDGDACYNFKWYRIAKMVTCECAEDDCNRGSVQIPGITIVVFSLIWIFIYLKSNDT